MKKILILVLVIVHLKSISYNLELNKIYDGIEYTNLTIQHPEPLFIHITKIDPKKVQIKLEHALGYNREEVSSIAKRTEALVACNAGNYRRGGRWNGNALNILKIQDAIHSDPQFNRGALLWTNETNPIIDFLTLKWSLKIKNIPLEVNRINQPFNNNESIIYTKSFSPTTLTNGCTEIIVENNSVISINQKGNSKVPENGFVYATHSLDSQSIAIGAPVELSVTGITQKKEFIIDDINYIIGGSGLLVKDNQIHSDFNKEFAAGKPIIHCGDEVAADFHDDTVRNWLVSKKHPRTAIGLTKDNQWIFVVVEGRLPEKSIGMTLYELAEFMHSIGCVDALNLGGGGCSTLFIKEKGVVNNTSGSENSDNTGQERPVSDAIIVLAKD